MIWTDGTNYIKDLEKYIAENNSRLAQIKTEITSNDSLRVEIYAAIDHARELVRSLSSFRNGRYQNLENHFAPFNLNDHETNKETWEMEDEIGKLPPAPPSYHISETMPEPSDDEGNASGTDATHATTTAGTTSLPTGTSSHPPAGPVSLNVAPGTPANHNLSVQVEMVHPSVLAGSSTAVLHADTVMHDLPIIHAIIDAWITYLASLGAD